MVKKLKIMFIVTCERPLFQSFLPSCFVRVTFMCCVYVYFYDDCLNNAERMLLMHGFEFLFCTLIEHSWFAWDCAFCFVSICVVTRRDSPLYYNQYKLVHSTQTRSLIRYICEFDSVLNQKESIRIRIRRNINCARILFFCHCLLVSCFLGCYFLLLGYWTIYWYIVSLNLINKVSCVFLLFNAFKMLILTWLIFFFEKITFQ